MKNLHVLFLASLLMATPLLSTDLQYPSHNKTEDSQWSKLKKHICRNPLEWVVGICALTKIASKNILLSNGKLDKLMDLCHVIIVGGALYNEEKIGSWLFLSLQKCI